MKQKQKYQSAIDKMKTYVNGDTPPPPTNNSGGTRPKPGAKAWLLISLFGVAYSLFWRVHMCKHEPFAGYKTCQVWEYPNIKLGDGFLSESSEIGYEWSGLTDFMEVQFLGKSFEDMKTMIAFQKKLLIIDLFVVAALARGVSSSSIIREFPLGKRFPMMTISLGAGELFFQYLYT